MNDSILLIGLKKANITIKDLIEANLDNLNPNARIPPESSYKNSQEFIQKVQEKLQNPHVADLAKVVDVLMQKNSSRIRKAPKRSLKKQQPSDQSISAEKHDNQIENEPKTSMRNKNSVSLSMKVTQFEIVPESVNEYNSSIQDNGSHQIPPASRVDQTIQTIHHNQDQYQTRNHKSLAAQKSSPQFSTVPLQYQERSDLTIKVQTPLRQSIVDRFSQETSSVQKDSLSLSFRGIPFKRNPSPKLLMHGSSQPVLTPNHYHEGPQFANTQFNNPNQSKAVTKGQRSLLKKFLKKPRKSTVISENPRSLVNLTAKGNQLRAERMKIKRQKLMEMKKRIEEESGKRSKLFRGEEGYVSSASDCSSQTSQSSVSFQGVPELDIEYLEDKAIAKEIKERRDKRRKIKHHLQFRDYVQQSVLRELSVGLSKQTELADRLSPQESQFNRELIELVNKNPSFSQLRAQLSDTTTKNESLSKISKPLATTQTLLPDEDETQIDPNMFKNLFKLKDSLANAMRFSMEEAPKHQNPFQRTIIATNLQGVSNTDITERSNNSSSFTPFNVSVMRPTYYQSGFESNEANEDEQLKNLQDSINKLILDLTTEQLENQYAQFGILGDLKVDLTKIAGTRDAHTLTFGYQNLDTQLKQQQSPTNPNQLTKPSKLTDQALYVVHRDKLEKRLQAFNRTTASTSPKFSESKTQENHLEAMLVKLMLGKVAQTLNKDGTKHNLINKLQAGLQMQFINNLENNNQTKQTKSSDFIDKIKLLKTLEMFSVNSNTFTERSQRSSALDKVKGMEVEVARPVLNMASCNESNDKQPGTESNSPHLQHKYPQSFENLNNLSNSVTSQYSFNPNLVKSAVLINDDSIRNLQPITNKVETPKPDVKHQSTFKDGGCGIIIDQKSLHTRNEPENKDLMLEIKFANEEENQSKQARKNEIKKRIKMTAGFKKEPFALKNQLESAKVAHAKLKKESEQKPSHVSTHVFISPAISQNKIEAIQEDPVKKINVTVPNQINNQSKDAFIQQQQTNYSFNDQVQKQNELPDFKQDILTQIILPENWEQAKIIDIQNIDCRLVPDQIKMVQKGLSGHMLQGTLKMPKHSKKLYQELCKEIELQGDLSSISSAQNQKLMNFQIQGLKQRLIKKQHNRNMSYIETNSLQKLLHEKKEALLSNFTAQQVKIHVKTNSSNLKGRTEDPRSMTAMNQEPENNEQENDADNETQFKSQSNLVTAKYNHDCKQSLNTLKMSNNNLQMYKQESSGSKLSRPAFKKKQSRDPLLSNKQNISHVLSFVQKKIDLEHKITSPTLTPLGLFTSDIEEERKKNAGFNQTSSFQLQSNWNHVLGSTSRTDQISPRQERDFQAKAVFQQETQISIPKPDDSPMVIKERASENQSQFYKSAKLKEEIDLSSPRHIQPSNIYLQAKMDYENLILNEINSPTSQPFANNNGEFTQELFAGQKFRSPNASMTSKKYLHISQTVVQSHYPQTTRNEQHSSLSNKKFLAGRRDSNNGPLKSQFTKPLGGGFKFKQKTKASKLQNDPLIPLLFDAPGLMIKTTQIVERQPSIKKVEMFSIKELGLEERKNQDIPSDPADDINSILRDASEDNLNQQAGLQQKSFFSQNSVHVRKRKISVIPQIKQIPSIDRSLAEWSRSRHVDSPDNTILKAKISEPKLKQIMPAILPEITDLTSKTSPQNTSGFTLNKDKAKITHTNLILNENDGFAQTQNNYKNQKSKVFGKGSEAILEAFRSQQNNSGMQTNQEPTSPLSSKKGMGNKKRNKIEHEQLQDFVQKTVLPFYSLMENTVKTGQSVSTVKGQASMIGAQWENNFQRQKVIFVNIQDKNKKVPSKMYDKAEKPITQPASPTREIHETNNLLLMLLNNQPQQMQQPQLGMQGYKKKQGQQPQKIFEFNESKGQCALNRIMGKLPFVQTTTEERITQMQSTLMQDISVDASSFPAVHRHKERSDKQVFQSTPHVTKNQRNKMDDLTLVRNLDSLKSLELLERRR